LHNSTVFIVTKSGEGRPARAGVQQELKEL